MNEQEDNTELGWGGNGTAGSGGDALTSAVSGAGTPLPATPPVPGPADGGVGQVNAAEAPTMAEIQPPTPPLPPQPLGVPAPTPGMPTMAQPPYEAVVPAGVAATPYQSGATGPMAAVAGTGYAGTGYPGAQPGSPPSNKGLWIALAVVGAIAVVGLVVVAVLLMRGSDTKTSDTLPADSTSSSSTTTTTVTSSTVAPTSAVPTTVTPPPTPPPVASVGSLSGGLLCKDLAARGVGYADAVRYYKREGYPDRMDADGNGIPCETVYSAASVQAYWGTVRTGSTLGLASGLMCKDLRGRGFDYGSAVEYWIADGFPDRMDADHNGIPCETVYSATEVRAFWDTVD